MGPSRASPTLTSRALFVHATLFCTLLPFLPFSCPSCFITVHPRISQIHQSVLPLIQYHPFPPQNNRAFLSQTEFTTASASFAPYDQYEVSIPLERAGTCLQEVGAEIYGPAKLYEGFRTPGLIRFVNGEEFYLSPTHGGPRMYINIEVG